MSESFRHQRYSAAIEMEACPAFSNALEERSRVETAGRAGRNQVHERRYRGEPRIAGGTGISNFLPQRPRKSALVSPPVDDSLEKRFIANRHGRRVEKRESPRTVCLWLDHRDSSVVRNGRAS